MHQQPQQQQQQQPFGQQVSSGKGSGQWPTAQSAAKDGPTSVLLNQARAEASEEPTQAMKQGCQQAEAQQPEMNQTSMAATIAAAVAAATAVNQTTPDQATIAAMGMNGNAAHLVAMSKNGKGWGSKGKGRDKGNLGPKGKGKGGPKGFMGTPPKEAQ